MDNTLTHIDTVYVCFLPQQRSQWVDIHPVIDQLVQEYYTKKKDRLDEVKDNIRVIGIKVGNLKKYTLEDIYLLHYELIQVLKQHHVDIVNVLLLAKYLSERDMRAFFWTIAPFADIEGSVIEGEVIHPLIQGYDVFEWIAQRYESFSSHHLYQMLPLTYHLQTTMQVFESFNDYVKKVVICLDENVLLPLMIAADSNTKVIVPHFSDCFVDTTWLSRPGIRVKYQKLSDGIIFDLLHYGMQYHCAPIVIKKISSCQPLVKTYGATRVNLDDFRVLSPQFTLFDSKLKHQQIMANGMVNLESYQDYHDYYQKAFDILEMDIDLPVFYQVEILKKILTKG